MNKKTIHICCFGASVTEQSIRHDTGEVVGYVNHLEEILTVHTSDVIYWKVDRVAVGSCHFRDAGKYLLKEVVDKKPDIILFDWHTTSMKSLDLEQVNYTIDFCCKHQIIPIFMILPRRDHNPLLPKYNTFKEKIASEFFLDFHDLFDKSDIEIMTRDVVHTNSYGGECYANQIYREIKKRDLHNSQTLEKIKAFLPYKVKKQGVDESQAFMTTKLNTKLHNPKVIKVKALEGGSFSVFGIKGPFTGNMLISLLSSGSLKRKDKVIDIVDQWCHFERRVFWPEFHLDKGDEIEIKVHNKLPDYKNKCPKLFEKYEKEPWSAEDLALKVISIYHSSGIELE